MKRRAHLSLAVLGAVVASAIIPASAQVPPPTRDRGNDNSKPTPNYVDSADYDREPYYVDGVQYKPYVPEQKKKAKPASETMPAASTPVDAASSPPAPGELHPFVPPSSVVAKPENDAGMQVAQSDASSSSSSSSVSYTPKKRTRYASAIIEALDKVTAESVRFEAPIGSAVRYKGLIYIVKACETTADDETQPDVIAYMQVRTSPSDATHTSLAVQSKEIFQGWTFASTPSLNPIQHPIYDAWVVACRKPLAG